MSGLMASVCVAAAAMIVADIYELSLTLKHDFLFLTLAQVINPSDVCVPVCVSVCVPVCVCVLMVLQYLGILPPPIAPSCLVAISNRLIPSASSHFLLSNFTVSTAACGCRAWLLCTSSHWMLLKVKHVVSCCKC